MPTTSKSNRYRGSWLRRAEEKGLKVCNENGVFYTINGKTTKVMYSEAANPWFRIPSSLYSGKEEGNSPIDVFVFFCKRQDVFYAIDRKFIVSLKRQFSKKPSSSPTFYIDVARDKIHLPKRTYSIRPYRNSWQVFRQKPQHRIEKRTRFEAQIRRWLHNNFAKNGAFVADEKIIIGASGNAHKIDHVIYLCRNSRNSMGKRILIEVKNPGRGGKAPTGATFFVHMLRAFVALTDFEYYRNWPKFVLVPKRGKYGRFDFESFFEPMNIRLVAFGNRAERNSFKNLLKKMMN
jgi:hypothetical protein